MERSATSSRRLNLAKSHSQGRMHSRSPGTPTRPGSTSPDSDGSDGEEYFHRPDFTPLQTQPEGVVSAPHPPILNELRHEDFGTLMLRTQSEPQVGGQAGVSQPSLVSSRSSKRKYERPAYHPSESQPGAEPGVDPVRDASQYGHLATDCDIDVVDYSVERVSVREFRGKSSNKDFLEYLKTIDRDGCGKARSPEGWAKARWINVKGMDWGIIQALSLIYGLHPLALEDVLHSRDCRSKVDYYRDQLFVQGLALILDRDQEQDDDSVATDTEGEKKHNQSWISKFLGRPPSTDADLEAAKKGVLRHEKKFTGITARGRRMKAAQATVERLRGTRHVQVKERNLYIFMFREGTLITLHETKDSVNDSAIIDRLRNPQTGLRSAADISVLLQSLLDLMVDHAVQIVDAFQDQILTLEQDTLLRVNMDSVKLLHLLSADITLYKRALSPLKTAMYGMRRYDLDRCIALAASVHGTANPDTSGVRGFLSHQSKVYMADALDHLEYVLSSMEMFETVTENLISYSFNILSYDMNEIMRRLTLATVIFFPLTFLTGYFGMNFERMASLTNSDAFFWKICIPVTCGFLLMFSWRDVQKGLHYVRGRALSRVFQQTYARAGRRKNRRAMV